MHASTNSTKTISKKRKRASGDHDEAIPRTLSVDVLRRADGLKEYVDNRVNRGDAPFQVITVPATQPKKSLPADAQLIDDLFENRLAIRITMRPRNAWESMKAFKRFTVGDSQYNTDVSIGRGDYVLVKHEDGDMDEEVFDSSQQWKAKVLDIRAIDPEHVYILIAWLNRPEDLPSGRKIYHGRYELIPTNHLDVIDAASVNGKLDLVHWDEDSEFAPNADQYFWRQTYDAAYTKTFSNLKKICVDEVPHNPDEMIVQCPDESCKIWQHVRCLASRAVQTAAQQESATENGVSTFWKSLKKIGSANSVTKNKKSSQPVLGTVTDLELDPASAAVARATCDGIIAEVYIKDALPALNGVLDEEETNTHTNLNPVSHSHILITYPTDKRRAEETLRCMLCGSDML